MSWDVRELPLTEKYFNHLADVRHECGTYIGFKYFAPVLFFLDEIRGESGIAKVEAECEAAALNAAEARNWQALAALKSCTVTSRVLSITHEECVATLERQAPLVIKRFETESAFFAPMSIFYAWAKRVELVRENTFRTASREFLSSRRVLRSYGPDA